jgi:zinc-ribbon domain
MAYLGDLGSGQQLLVENRGAQTIITLSTGSASQQQSQQSTVQTGEWHSAPTLFQTARGLILRIEAAQGHTFISLHANAIGLLKGLPSMVGAKVLPLQKTADSSSPMQPMQPMQMGNMRMQMNPMEMQMGDLRLKMDDISSTPTDQRFCSQCGSRVSKTDRFCAQCGTHLSG